MTREDIIAQDLVKAESIMGDYHEQSSSFEPNAVITSR